MLTFILTMTTKFLTTTNFAGIFAFVTHYRKKWHITLHCSLYHRNFNI